MSKPCFAADIRIRNKGRRFAPVKVDGQETSLPNVHVPKPWIGKSRELRGGRMHVRIRFAHNAPEELRRLRASMLMTLEKLEPEV
ncbi:MAG TPA: hypothetical protein VIW68_12845 [Candidatus Sulfotelmatobacter sp.]